MITFRSSDISISPDRVEIGRVYITDSFCVVIYGKWPNWFHRAMAGLLLGWQWRKYE